MEKIVTFEEIMLRLAPNGYNRFFQDDQFQVTFGDGEADVVAFPVNYGMHAASVTKLLSHAVGQGTVNTLQALGTDIFHVVRGGGRVGIYYLERGASQQDGMCIYDWAYSATQQAKAEDFDWDSIFENAAWLHFTDIIPVLRGNLVGICLQVCQTAKARGVKISCDLNYRNKLWSRTQARAAMTELYRYIDVCIANEEDAKDIFSIEAADSDIYGGKLNKSDYESVVRQLAGQFGLEKVAITLRTSLSASGNNWVGMLYDGTERHALKEYRLRTVDRVGDGDSFAGGLICALLSGKPAQDTIEFVVVASILKHSVEGDFNHVTCNEVEKLASGDDPGRVQRQVAILEKLREQ